MLFHNRYILLYLSLILTISFTACKDENKFSVKLDGTEKNVEITYFDEAFWAIQGLSFTEDLAELKNKYPDFFLNKTVSDADWRKRYMDGALKNFSDSLSILFKDSTQYHTEINAGFKRFQHYYKGVKVPQLSAWFSNFEMEKPIVSSENTLFIGKEHFLGPRHIFYKGVPEYIRFDKQMSFLGPKIMLEWSQRFNITLEKNQSFLSKIIFEGKQLYFAEQLLQLEEDHRIIAYSREDLAWAKKNEASIWQFFINNDYLFSTEQKLSRRFIEPSPFSKFYTGNDNITPGRIGSWIGWRIVQSYMKHNPSITLPQLMQEKNAKKILNKSKYKPKI